MSAPAPNRSSMKFTLSMGVTAIPVTCYKGDEDVSLKRSEYDCEGRKVGRVSVIKDTDPVEVISASDVIHCVETEAGLVPLSDEEIHALDFGMAPETANVEGFLPLASLGSTYMPEGTMWQVRPEKRNKGAERSLAVLLKGLRRKACFALVEFCTRGKPKYAALLGNGRMYLLHYDEEVREDLPLPSHKPTDDEMRVMDLLIETMTPTELPVLSDRFASVVMDFVHAKAEEGGVLKPVEQGDPEEAAGRVTGLMDMLRASVEQAEAKKAAKS